MGDHPRPHLSHAPGLVVSRASPRSGPTPHNGCIKACRSYGGSSLGFPSGNVMQPMAPDPERWQGRTFPKAGQLEATASVDVSDEDRQGGIHHEG